MDSNNCISNESQNAIIRGIETGEISRLEACKRLEMAIDMELQKPESEVDMSFVSTSTDLLYMLTHDEAYTSRAPEYRAKLERRLDKRRYDRPFLKRVVVVLGIASMLFVIMVVGDAMLRREELHGVSTQDEQQYVVIGINQDPGIINPGIADPVISEIELTTDKYNEAVDAIGYTPLTPSWIADGWSIRDYYCYVDSEYNKFVMRMVSTEFDDLLRYEVMVYEDPEIAGFVFEQNEHGQVEHLNGWDVYVTMNIDNCAAIWLDGKTSYSLYGPITVNDLLKMITSIERGAK